MHHKRPQNTDTLLPCRHHPQRCCDQLLAEPSRAMKIRPHGGLDIVGNEDLSWSQVGPEDFILLNKYMLQGLSCSSYMIKLHPGMHLSMNPRNDVMKHGCKTWSVVRYSPARFYSPGPGAETENPTLGLEGCEKLHCLATTIHGHEY